MKRRGFLCGMAAAPLAVTVTKDSGPQAEPFLGRFIHEAGDGLPPREAFVDGRKIEYAFFADLRSGVVRYHLTSNGRPVVQGGTTLEGEARGRVEIRLSR